MNAKREIGGYLELERFSGEPYHADAIALNCGRACLEYLIELRAINAIGLPDWMCSTVYETCTRCDTKVLSYRIGADMRPVYDFEIGDGEWLYLMDYYGQLTAEDIDDALTRTNRLIVDEAQGFFRRPWRDADTLYTCRKFFGVADGGYLYTSDGMRLERRLEADESHDHMGYLLGRFERPASEYFADSKKNNARFANAPAHAMSPITENLMRAVDYENAKARREENYAFVRDELRDFNHLQLELPEGPFMYPLLIDDADGIRSKLADEGIFIPVLWPNVLDEQPEASVAYRYTKDLLPLPVDQRYGAEDMLFMVEKLREHISHTS